MARRWQLPGVVGVFVVPLAAIALVVVGSPGAGGQPAAVAPVARGMRGAVDAGGTAEGPSSGWRVAHPADGRYVLSFDDPTTSDVDVTSWDTVSDVVVGPHGDGVFEVSFRRDGSRLESRFRFVAH
jgi:hypothetical protein